MIPTRARETKKRKPRKRLHPARSNGRHPGGRPTAYNPQLGQKICAIVAEGASFAKALAQLGIQERTGYRWASAHPDFRQDLMRAREIRADFSFGEQILDIADNSADDWSYNEKTGKLSVNKEAMLRSKLRIEARQFHMSRLHPQVWGERQQIDLKSDWSLLTLEERQRKAEELIQMIEDLKKPPMEAPAIVYRPEEPSEDDDQQQRGVGWQPRSVTGREG